MLNLNEYLYLSRKVRAWTIDELKYELTWTTKNRSIRGSYMLISIYKRELAIREGRVA